MGIRTDPFIDRVSWALQVMPPLMDHTADLLAQGYGWGLQHFRHEGSSIFESRLLGRPVTVLRGEDAAKRFYDTMLVRRAGGMPARVQRSFLGVGGVQSLDGDEHRFRKQMLLSTQTPDRIASLRAHAREGYERALSSWVGVSRVRLLDASAEVLTDAVCRWAGVELPRHEVAHRARSLMALIDSPAAIGPRHWQGLAAQRSLAAWLQPQIEHARRDGGTERPLDTIACATHTSGRPLDAHVATVELINLLRPTVAVSRYVVFAAMALGEHPASMRPMWSERAARLAFVHEVRRFFPFFPMVAGVTRLPFAIDGHHVPAERRILLDLYATDHDERRWSEPDRFLAGRFLDAPPDAYDLVPQGGGSTTDGHRCAGEDATIALMLDALDLLTERIDYDVPPQDLRLSLARIPARPNSGYLLSNVRLRSTRARSTSAPADASLTAPSTTP